MSLPAGVEEMFLKPDYSCQISSVLKVTANSGTSWKCILSLSVVVEKPKAELLQSLNSDFIVLLSEERGNNLSLQTQKLQWLSRSSMENIVGKENG